MRHDNPGSWAVRISWPLLGGVLGAWQGFGGYLRLPASADSFANLLASGFFGVFAWLGLFAGMGLGALIGGSVEKLLRRFGVGIASALGVATVLNALALWQIAGVVQARYPGLRPPAARPAVPSTNSLPSGNACAHPLVMNARERADWELECR